MPRKEPSSGHCIWKLTLILLAFSVFSLGLQAKLALYKKNPDLRIAAVRLCTEKPAKGALEVTDASERTDFDLKFLAFVAFRRSFDVQRFPYTVVQYAEAGLSDPNRFTLHVVHSLRRPPPFLM